MRPSILKLLALFLSLLFHGLIALALVFGLKHLSAPSRKTVEVVRLEIEHGKDDATTDHQPQAPDPQPPTPSPKPPTPQSLDLPLEPISVTPHLSPDSSLPQPPPPSDQLPPTTCKPPPATRHQPTANSQLLTATLNPRYPQASRRRGEQGRVTLEVHVDAGGMVTDVRVAKSSGFPLLDKAAMAAARAARFTPATSEGKSVPVVVLLPLDFRLKE